MPNRREFLKGLPTVMSVAALHQARSIAGTLAGEERTIEGIRLCWCPPGRFVMGSPLTEADHRPDEAQVDVTLTQGFLDGEVRSHAGAVAAVSSVIFRTGRQPTEFGQGRRRAAVLGELPVGRTVLRARHRGGEALGIAS